MHMKKFSEMNARERLVSHVQELERLESVKDLAVDRLKTGFAELAKRSISQPISGPQENESQK